jgi:hypothetical protein
MPRRGKAIVDGAHLKICPCAFRIIVIKRLVRFWHKPAVGTWAEHVRSAPVHQTSTCSAITKASLRRRDIYRAFDFGVARQRLDGSSQGNDLKTTGPEVCYFCGEPLF